MSKPIMSYKAAAAMKTVRTTPMSTPDRPKKRVDEKATPGKAKVVKNSPFPVGDIRNHTRKVTPGANRPPKALETTITFHKDVTSSDALNEDIVGRDEDLETKLDHKFESLEDTNDHDDDQIEKNDENNDNDSNKSTDTTKDVEMEDMEPSEDEEDDEMEITMVTKNGSKMDNNRANAATRELTSSRNDDSGKTDNENEIRVMDGKQSIDKERVGMGTRHSKSTRQPKEEKKIKSSQRRKVINDAEDNGVEKCNEGTSETNEKMEVDQTKETNDNEEELLDDIRDDAAKDDGVTLDVSQKITKHSVQWKDEEKETVVEPFTTLATNGFGRKNDLITVKSLPIVPVTISLKLPVDEELNRGREAAKQLNTVMKLVRNEKANEGISFEMKLVPLRKYKKEPDLENFSENAGLTALEKYMDIYRIKNKMGKDPPSFRERTQVTVKARFNHRYAVVRNKCIQSLMIHGFDLQLKEIPQRDSTLIGVLYPSFDCIDSELIEQFMWERRRKLVNIRPVMFDNDPLINEDNEEDWDQNVKYKRAYGYQNIKDYGAAMGVYAEEVNTNAYDVMEIMEEDFSPRLPDEYIGTYVIEAMVTFIRVTTKRLIHDDHLKNVSVLPLVLMKQFRHSARTIGDGGGAFAIKLLKDVESLDKPMKFKSFKKTDKKATLRNFIHSLTVRLEITVGEDKVKRRMRCFDAVKVNPTPYNTSSTNVKFTTHFASSATVSEFISQKAKKMIDGLGMTIIDEIGKECAREVLAATILSGLERDHNLSSMTQLDPEYEFICIPDELKTEMEDAVADDDVDSVHTGHTTLTGGTKVSKRLLIEAQTENEEMRETIERLEQQLKENGRNSTQESGQDSSDQSESSSHPKTTQSSVTELGQQPSEFFIENTGSQRLSPPNPPVGDTAGDSN